MTHSQQQFRRSLSISHHAIARSAFVARGSEHTASTIKWAAVLLALATCLLATTIVSGAEVDMVYQKGEGKTIGGQISSVTRAEVVVFQRVGNREERVPAYLIDRVEWKDESPGLALGRGAERTGKFAEAGSAYQQVLDGLTNRGSPMAIDIEFLLARLQAKQAESDETFAPSAVESLQRFVNAYGTHFRYFEAYRLLGESALLADKLDVARTAFERLGEAPWDDVKLASRIGLARVLVAENQPAEARPVFEEIVALPAGSPDQQGRRLQAMLGLAQCQEMQGAHQDAGTTLQTVIDESPAGDSRTLALAYLQLGHCLMSQGDVPKQAVLAYLRVDVIPELSAQKDLHAESLYYLSKLWPAIGQPARGADAAARLEQDYPRSAWAKKLASGA